jgi:hypothetical protein
MPYLVALAIALLLGQHVLAATDQLRSTDSTTSTPGNYMVLSASMGKVTFLHLQHGSSKVKCSSCHTAEGGVSKSWAHKTCKGCHAEMRKGPTFCRDCHKK